MFFVQNDDVQSCQRGKLQSRAFQIFYDEPMKLQEIFHPQFIRFFKVIYWKSLTGSLSPALSFVVYDQTLT